MLCMNLKQEEDPCNEYRPVFSNSGFWDTLVQWNAFWGNIAAFAVLLEVSMSGSPEKSNKETCLT